MSNIGTYIYQQVTKTCQYVPAYANVGNGGDIAIVFNPDHPCKICNDMSCDNYKCTSCNIYICDHHANSCYDCAHGNLLCDNCLLSHHCPGVD